MTTCRHLTDPMTSQCCTAGVDYLRLTGGGVYSMALRLPCYELEDRKGHEVARCAGYSAVQHDQQDQDANQVGCGHVVSPEKGIVAADAGVMHTVTICEEPRVMDTANSRETACP
jgi:short subunit dehydrogenase-like uncharacterized protein